MAVIVTFNPEEKGFLNLVAALKNQVDLIAVIDNGSKNFSLCPLESHVLFLRNEDNLGVAQAYNQGVALAREHGASHILLFDQDSCPASDMVTNLKNAYESYQGGRVAAVGPRYSDIKGEHVSPFVVLRGVFLDRLECADTQVVEVDHLISSGSLISLSAISDVGLFEDKLFIDYVDTEWCWRARCRGYQLLGVGSARMSHKLGEAHFYVFGKPCILHAPFRLYYQMRNQWWMIFQPGIGWRWRIMDVIRSVKVFIVIALFAPERSRRISYMLKGIAHAFGRRMGKLDDGAIKVPENKSGPID